MEPCIKSILLKLERAKKRLVLVTQPPLGHVGELPTKGSAAVQAQLRSARQAAQAAAAAARGQSAADYDLVLREASTVVDALALVAASGTAATEALSISALVAGTLAQVQRQQAFGFADTARQAIERGDLTAAAREAVQAKEAAAVAMWAACVGGLQLVTEINSALCVALREADAAVEVVEAARAAGAAPRAPDQLSPDGTAVSTASAVFSAPFPPCVSSGPFATAAAELAADPTTEPAAERAAAIAEARTTVEAAEAAAAVPGGSLGQAAEPVLAAVSVAQAVCGASGTTNSPTLQLAPTPADVTSAPTAPAEAAQVEGAFHTDSPAVAAAAARSAAAETPSRAGGSSSAAVSSEATAVLAHTAAPAEGATQADVPAPAAAVAMIDADMAAKAGAATDAEVGADAEGAASAGGVMAAAATACEDAAARAAADGFAAAPAGPGASAAAGCPHVPSHSPPCSRPLEAAPPALSPHGTDVSSGEDAPAAATAAAAGQGATAAAEQAAATALPCAAGPSVPGAAEDGLLSAGCGMEPIVMEAAGDGRNGRRPGGDVASGAGPSDGRVLHRPLGFGSILGRGVLLSSLASLANEALAPDVVVQTAGVKLETQVAFSAGYGHQDDSEAMRIAWALPETRCGLVRLLSYTVRDLQELWMSAAGCDLRRSGRVLEFLASCVDALFGFPADSPDVQAVLAAVTRLLVRTDLMQCLSRLFAGMASTAAAAISAALKAPPAAEDLGAGGQPTEAEGGAGAGAAANAAGAAAGGAAREEPGAPRGPTWTDVQQHLVRMLMKCALCCGRHGEQATGELAAALQSLGGTIRSSRVMEHAARAVSLSLGSLEPSARANAESGQAVLMFARRLAMFIQWRASSTQRPLAVWADVLLSAPCVQKFLLLHAVSQIANVDKGPSYGLPSLARLPSEVMVPLTLAAAASDNRIRLGAGPPSFFDASADLTAMSFHWWARNRARPCKDRALRLVCERAAAAASASSAAGAVRPSGAAGSSLRFDPGASMDLALAALDCAVALVQGGSAGDLRGLWAPVVRTANAAVHVRPRLGLPDLGPLQLLAKLPLPSLGEVMAAGDGAPLPPDPSPNLAAALAAGYVPCLERCIRAEMRLAAGGPSSGQSVPVLRCITSLLQRAGGIASLMAYDDLTAVAALIATSAKAFEATFVKKGDAAVYELLNDITSTSSIIAVSTLTNSSIFVGPQDRRWWCRHDPKEAGGVATGPAPGDGSAPGTSSGSGRGGNSGGGNRSDSGDNSSSGPSAPLLPAAPLHRLSLLATFALMRWLPVLRRMLEAFTQGGPKRCKRSFGMGFPFAVAVLGWATLPILAYLTCLEAEGGLQQAGGCAGGSRSSGSRDRAATAASSSGSSSWEQLLLGSTDLPGLMQLAGQAVCQQYITGKVANGVVSLFSRVLAYFLVAFPRQGRTLLQTQISPGVTLLAWVQDRLCDSSGPNSFTHFLELAPAVADGRDPGEEDVAWLRDIDGIAVGLLRLAAVLPPPCFVEMALRLPTCAKPGCTNLEGDSEAGMRGSAAYCSRDCRKAHKRAEGGGVRGRGR
ncbi:hypothetical protein PLESTF_001043800 [Pleodorina starrii]|nr:hypothetical protein PLESTM_001118100 [Pleodorina starrii]GLC70890.1 hypothetical protein PLESTF_001043800 [Pleodorina starrii]